MKGEVRLWIWELESINIREWGLPTGTNLWRSWRCLYKTGWWVSQFVPDHVPDSVAIRHMHVVLRSGPRHRR